MDRILQETSWKEYLPSWFNTCSYFFSLPYMQMLFKRSSCIWHSLLVLCMWQVIWRSSQPSSLLYDFPWPKFSYRILKAFLIIHDDYIPNHKALLGTLHACMRSANLECNSSPEFLTSNLTYSGFNPRCLKATSQFFNLLCHVSHIFLISVSS